MGVDVSQRWDVRASVSQGQKRRRVCLTAVGTFDLDPRDIWRLLSLPEGAPIFRVEQRQVLVQDTAKGKTEEEVVFLAPVRVLFWKAWAKTRVLQCVDASDPTSLTVTFSLISSSLMSHLTGSWNMQQLQPKGPSGQPPVTKVAYTFEMWPKGVPPALHFMPGLIEAVKGAVTREAAQLFDKIQYVADKVGPGMPLTAALRTAADDVAVSGGSFKQLKLSLSQRAASSDSSCCSDDTGTGSLAVEADALGTCSPGTAVALH